MRNKFLKVALLGALCTVSSYLSAASITAAQEVAAAGNLCKSLANLSASSKFLPADLVLEDLDGATVGTLAISAPKYFKYNATDDTLSAFGYDGTSSSVGWYTLKSDAIGTGHDGSSPVTLTFGSVTKDGAANTAATDLLEVTFTKDTGVLTLSRAQILAFLNNVNFATVPSHALAINVTGSVAPVTKLATALYTATATSYTSTSTLPVGWWAKIIRGQAPGGGATAVTTMMPIAATLTLPLTPVGGTATNHVAQLTDIGSSLNVTAASSSALVASFANSSTGFELPISFYGAKFDRNAGWWAQALAALSAGTRVTPSTGVASTALVPSAIDYVRKLVKTGDTANTASAVIDASSLAGLLGDRFAEIMAKTGIAYADSAADVGSAATRLFTTDTVARPQAICFAFTQSGAGFGYVSSSVSGATLNVAMRYATAVATTPVVSPATKTFSTTFADQAFSAGDVVRFDAPDGDCWFMKVTDATNYITATGTTIATELQSAIDTALTGKYVTGLTLQQLIALV